MEKFDTFRDPLLSIYQSAVADVASQLDERPSDGARAGVSPSAISALTEMAANIAADQYALQLGIPRETGTLRPRDLTKTEWSRVCAEQAFRYLKAEATNDAVTLARIRDEFKTGVCDPAWLSTMDEYRKFFGSEGVIPYVRPASVGKSVIEIKSDAKIAIAGDWGTGAQPAIELLRQIGDSNPDVFIHLGDIYYSGTPLECRKNFYEPVDRVLRAAGRDTKVYTLSGNHDMYCGGVGYYDLICKLNPAPFTQPASFFCLRSKDERWQFLALDTGLHDFRPLHAADTLTYLEQEEIEWHCERIKEFSGRTILLSHHQLFSAYSTINAVQSGKRPAVNANLADAFKKMAQLGNISAWFWGHEHTLSIYNPFAGLKRGRCLGHGAVPTSIVDKIYEPLADLVETPTVKATRLAQVGGVYAHGFAELKLAGDVCEAAYYENNNGRKALMFEEQLD